MPTASENKSPKKIPLLYVLVTALVTLTVIATGLVAYLSFYNGQCAVNDVADQLRGEITIRIEDQVHTFLDTPNQINQTNANILEHGLIAADDPLALEHHFWEQIQIFDTVSSIYFGNIDGGLVNAGREAEDDSLYVILTDGFVSGPFNKYATDDEGEHTDLVVTVSDFDARTRLWYSDAVDTGTAVWSDVYIVFTGHDMAISTGLPVYDGDQQLMGVVSIDLFLSQLSNFLQSLDIGETGEAFIIERSGLMVASSSQEKPFTEPDENGEQRRIHAYESDISLIRTASEALTEEFPDYGDITETQQLEFEIDGVRHFVQVSPIDNDAGLDWLVAVVIPESDFMAQINANNRVTFALIAITLIAAITLGIFVTRKITQPVLRVSTFAQALSKGEWEQPISHDSRIREISTLTRSLNYMAEQLQRTVAELTVEVAERKQAEADLLLSREHYQMLFNESPAPLWEEDFSEVYVYLENCKRDGVHDFRAYFEENPDELTVCAQKVEIREVNQATLELHQAENKEQLVNNLEKTFTAKSFEVFKEELIAIAAGQLKFESEVEVQTLAGELRYISLRLSISDRSDSKRALLATTDITASKQAEKEQLKLKKLESLGVLAGGIAHDFNNLLTGLYGNLELAKIFLATDHKSYKYLKSAGDSMERATRLTQQLLTFARGGSPVKKTLSIGEVIAETAQFSLRGSNSRLQTRISSRLWLIEADKGQISQVISNLVINAQQATPTGGVITIVAENTVTAEGRFVKVAVKDEGIGIAPQYLDKIFDPYFSTKQQGSGLGLASTHSIISKHNGRITVDSRLNHGTTFTIYLPAAEETEEAVMALAEPMGVSTAVSVTSAHILVMDDEELVRNVIGAMLEKMGHEVTYTVDGQGAVAKYRLAYENGVMYDLVITDLTIPGGMGGQEAAQEILKINPQAKIIVSSGYATGSVMADYAAYGFSGIVVKPYRFAELEEAIRQVII